MSELEEKLGQILSNPQMMQQIMSLAQTMGSNAPAKEEQPIKKQEQAASIPTLDPAILQKVAGMAAGTSIDANQKALLRALGPYISRDRVGKLEKAMRAAKMAALASSFLQSGPSSVLGGR